MISEHQQATASLYVLGALVGPERDAFVAALQADPELRDLVGSLEKTVGLVAKAIPSVTPPAGLRDRILRAAETGDRASIAPEGLNPGFYFVGAADASGWKALPFPGAYIKLLSADRERGYAVLMGRLEPGVRYPAHEHDSAEEIYLLTGDLTIAGRRMGPGDFHHCAAGTSHPVNFSDEGCTLLAVLALDHHLTQFAMS